LENRKYGVLLVNLGTPNAPDRGSVARYLRQFLSDPRVIDLPRWLWLPLLNLVIIPLRAGRSAAAYRSIWRDDGSPLFVYTHQLAAKMARTMTPHAPVVVAMRYGDPSIPQALEKLRESGVPEIVVLPLYPQFSYTTTASVYDAIATTLRRMRWNPHIHRIEDYHLHTDWVAAVAASIRTFRIQRGPADKLLFSFHGIPKRYVTKGDPYEAQCRAGAAAIASAAGLQDEDWMLTYQSRVGREPWLMPYTDLTLKALAAKGVRNVQVVCPGFAVDCLETLEEIALRYRELFEHAGGERLEYIPALNDSDAHVNALRRLVYQALQFPPTLVG
jgi:ferrochelatase